jgi:hypothetical protein
MTSEPVMTIKEQWESYVRAVMPASVGQVQLQETRRAFYAGAYAMITALTAGVSDEAEMTPQDVNVMESLHRELEQFYSDVKQGKA